MLNPFQNKRVVISIVLKDQHLKVNQLSRYGSSCPLELFFSQKKNN
ncbi:hypothetical protein I3843_05G140200 [Carya illinoinensis]|nr:hypothetical protein I3843_05G140200 [Carya illinoinensis]